MEMLQQEQQQQPQLQQQQFFDPADPIYQAMMSAAQAPPKAVSVPEVSFSSALAVGSLLNEFYVERG